MKIVLLAEKIVI